MVIVGNRHIFLYLAYTTVDFVFHTLLEAFQLGLEKSQIL